MACILLRRLCSVSGLPQPQRFTVPIRRDLCASALRLCRSVHRRSVAFCSPVRQGTTLSVQDFGTALES